MKDVQNILQHVAPSLASALGGPFSGLASKFITDNLSTAENPLDVKGSEFGSVLKPLLNDTDQLAQIKTLDKKFQEELQKLELDIFSLEKENNNSTGTLTYEDNRPQIFISVAFVSAYFLLLGGVFWAEISPNFNPGMAFKDGKWVEQSHSLIDLFKVLIGVLTAGVGQILSFWFGGIIKNHSSSSNDKA